MDLVGTLVECANLVYQALGTGHSESVYHRAMEVELRARMIWFETKVILPVMYRGLNVGYSEADLIVYGGGDEDKQSGLIVELKATTYKPRALERAQLMSYCRARLGSKHGMLINFRQPTATQPCPEGVDYEEVWCSVQERGCAPPHSEENAKGDNGDDNESKSKGG